MEKKYTFKEFVAAIESENFDRIDRNAIETTKSFFLKLHEQDFVYIDKEGKFSLSCDLSLLENYLKEYRMYQFDEEKFRREYLSE